MDSDRLLPCSEKGIIAVTAVLLAIACLYVPGVDAVTSPCNGAPVNNTGHELPALTNQYFARVEWRQLEMQRSTYMEIYYDKPGERSAVKVTGYYDAGETVVLITDYRNLKVYNIQDGTCSYKNVSATGGLFGIDYSKLKNGTGDLLNAFYSLDLIGNAAYQGDSVVRNTPVGQWRTCSINNNTDTTTTTDVYFSKLDWTSPSGSLGVPLRRVTSTMTSGVKSTMMMDYVYFKEGLPADVSVFQLPVTLQCTGRRKDVQVAAPPRHFSVDVETTLPQQNQSFYITIWYDEDANLTRMDSLFVPASSNNGKYRRTTIHDFTDDVQYDINNSDGSCTVSAIQYNPYLFPDTTPTDTIKTPRQLFELKGNFSYTGRTTLRGVPANVYMATLPPPPDVTYGNGVFTWYFSAASWNMMTSVDPATNFQIPLKVDVNYPKKPLHIVNNMYNFVTDKPDPATFRMDTCLETSDVRGVTFTLQGDSTGVMKKPKLLQQAIRKTLFTGLNISPLRIQDLLVTFSSNGTTVFLALLGLRNRTGSADRLAQRMVTSIDNSQFQVTVPWNSDFGIQNLTFQGVPHSALIDNKQGHVVDMSSTTSSPVNATNGCTSLQQQYTASSGVSKGGAAGIAIGTTVVGLILGLAMAYVFMSWRARRHQDDMKQTLTMDHVPS